MTRFKAGTSKEWQNGPRLAGEPMYLLKPSVKLKGTGYITKASKTASKKIAKLWADHLAGGNGGA